MRSLLASIILSSVLLAACSDDEDFASALVDAGAEVDLAREVDAGDIGLSAPADLGLSDSGDLGGSDAGADLGFSWPEVQGCNANPSFCDRRVEEIAWVTTHNAMSSEEDGWGAPNQEFNIRRQLVDGVRSFMIDTYVWEDDVFLCHGFCRLGNRLLLDLLLELDAFLELHPDDVLVLMLENYVPMPELDLVFEASGLVERAYFHPGGPWPTLAELTESGGRVIVFDNGAAELPWLNRTWDHAWETHFSAEALDDLDCEPNRGSTESELFILNHFLTNPIASTTWSKVANANPFFIERAQRCEAEHAQLPNFVTVDFYSLGDVFSVADTLNGF